MDNLFRIYRSFWENGNDFKDTTDRTDFWLAIWFNIIVFLAIFAYIMAFKRKAGVIFGIFVLVVYGIGSILPFLSIMCRRYNDVGMHKYWLFLTLVLQIILAVVHGTAWNVVAGILCLINLFVLALPTGQLKRH